MLAPWKLNGMPSEAEACSAPAGAGGFGVGDGRFAVVAAGFAAARPAFAAAALWVLSGVAGAGDSAGAGAPAGVGAGSGFAAVAGALGWARSVAAAFWVSLVSFFSAAFWAISGVGRLQNSNAETRPRETRVAITPSFTSRLRGAFTAVFPFLWA